jgi:hypothetical protein
VGGFGGRNGRNKRSERTAQDALTQTLDPDPKTDDVLFQLPVTKTWLRQLVLGLVLIGHSPFRAVLKHRRLERSDRPERVRKTPAELLAGHSHPHWLEMLGHTRFRRA